MHNLDLKWNCRTVALSGAALLLTATGALAQGHGGGGRGPALSGAQVSPGATVRIPSSGYAYGYGSSSYGSSGHQSSSHEHNGSSHDRWRQGEYGSYAFPYYVTTTNGWVGDPSLVQGGEAAPAPDQSVYNELDVLHQQVDQLRADQQVVASSQPPYAQNVPAAAPEKPPVALILVFRDGTRAEVQDYAVVGQFFWDLSNHGTRKIPISQLDLQASIKANDARGLEFPEVKQN